MGLKGRLEAEVELRSSGDLFHEMFGSKPHHVSKASPQHIQGCELHEGEFGQPGSIICWSYTVGGKPCTAKERVETVDNENKIVVLRVIEGDLMNDYKDFLATIQITPKIGGLDLVKWTLEFDTIHEEVPYPTYILDLVLNITKDIENHHLQA